MNFIETRGNDAKNPAEVSFSEAVLSPSASFGGLYVPKFLPKIDSDFLKRHINSSYKDLALEVLNSFEIDIDQSILQEAVGLYDKFDDESNPVPVVKVKEDFYVSELYHGPTRAFKDIALQPFGTILSHLAQKRGEDYLILAATSGDTGPAALHTFRGRENVKVACLYPDGGTSDVQRLQMVSEDATNLNVIGIKGVFDDAQNALKSLLASEEFAKELQKSNIYLSAANSVNFGRIIFQIIYHIHSYVELLKNGAISMGEKIYLIVPSGNFGNALGGYYAKKMGVPVEKILISSNANNILTDFITTGKYDLNGRKIVHTTSPAMDILKSSNVERVLFDLFGANRTKELMEDLQEHNRYSLTKGELDSLGEHFEASYSSDAEVSKVIKSCFEDGYLLDPHTATSIKAYERLRKKPLKTVAYSTAEWTKFSPVIDMAIGSHKVLLSDEEALESIAKKADIKVPHMIKELFNKDIKHGMVIEKDSIQDELISFIKGRA